MKIPICRYFYNEIGFKDPQSNLVKPTWKRIGPKPKGILFALKHPSSTMKLFI